MKIAHLGTFDVENYGDLLFPLILERRLASLGAEITHFSPVGGPPIWKDCVSSRPVGEIFENGKNFDAIIVGGGDIIQGVVGSAKVYGRKYLRTIFGYPSLWIAAAHSATEHRIPLCWNAPGVPWVMPPEHERMLRWAAGSADYLSVRSRQSRFRLLEAGVLNHIELVPDTGLEVSNLWTEAELDEAHARLWQRLGYAIPDRTVIVHLNPNHVQEGQEIVRCIEAISRTWQATAVLVPLCRWSGDEALQHRVAALMPNKRIVESKPESLREIVALFSHAKAYFGSSLHGFITASAFGKKGFLIAPNQGKFKGFLEWFGLERWIALEWRAAVEAAGDLLATPLDLWTSVKTSSERFLDKHWKQLSEVVQINGRRKSPWLEEFISSSRAAELSAYLPLVPEALVQEDQKPDDAEQNLWLQVFAQKNNDFNERDSMSEQIGPDRQSTLRFPHIEKLYKSGYFPLRIDPVNMPAIVQIFSILIVRDADKAVLYEAKNAEDFAKLNFAGDVLPRVGEFALFLIATGPDPQIYLPSFGHLEELSCTLEITLRVHSTDPELISFCRKLIEVRSDPGVYSESSRRLVSMENSGRYQQEGLAAKRSFEEIPPQQLVACCREHASKWKVSPAVHPQDFIFRFILNHTRFSGLDDAVRYYFDDARRSAEILSSILENDLSVHVAEKQKILEFASGYGAVTRHLQAVFPAFEITSSDIHPAANHFITEELGGKTIQSSAVPECFDAGGEYDLVFALSFFSHLPSATWSRWLSALFKTVGLGGNLIFTTHGPTSLRTMRADISLDEEGFFFKPESEQDDLDKDQYGTTFVSVGFVIRQVEALENCELRVIRAGLWWNHQDLYVVSKVPSAASFPVHDLNAYASDGKAEGCLDSISIGKKPGLREGRSTLRIVGWAAPDVKGDQPADSIIVLFQSEDGWQTSYEARREDRYDVARVFQNPALVRTGFRATINLIGLKGNLTLRLAVRCGSKRLLCHNVLIPLPSYPLG